MDSVHPEPWLTLIFKGLALKYLSRLRHFSSPVSSAPAQAPGPSCSLGQSGSRRTGGGLGPAGLDLTLLRVPGCPSLLGASRPSLGPGARRRCIGKRGVSRAHRVLGAIGTDSGGWRGVSVSTRLRPAWTEAKQTLAPEGLTVGPGESSTMCSSPGHPGLLVPPMPASAQSTGWAGLGDNWGLRRQEGLEAWAQGAAVQPSPLGLWQPALGPDPPGSGKPVSRLSSCGGLGSECPKDTLCPVV